MGYDLKDPEAAAKIIKELAGTAYEWCGVGVKLDRSPFRVEFEGRDQGRAAAGFTLMEQPNCCGLLISTRSWVAGTHQKQGIAQSLMSLKEAIAKAFGYSALIATVNITGNPVEVHILEKHGWKLTETFTNGRTANVVGIYTKVLN